MDPSALLLIDTTGNQVYYTLTYLGSISIAAAIAFWSGIRKGYPKMTWLLMIMLGGMFFILGEKLASWSSAEWTTFFTSLDLPRTGKKTILGGILGLFAGLIIAKKWFHFKAPVLDHFAIALPVCMAVSRLGCLMEGCCFGTPTQLPWGIQYGHESAAFHAHAFRGLVQYSDPVSAAVHPVQVYELIGCLLIACLVWISRKKWKGAEDLFLFSILCYSLLRFFMEFFRAPESGFVLLQPLFGLKMLQWVILGAVVAEIIILVVREVKSRNCIPALQFQPAGKFREVLVLVFLSCIAISGRKWFMSVEFILILMFLVPVDIFMLWTLCLRLIRQVFPGSMKFREQIVKYLINGMNLRASPEPDSAASGGELTQRTSTPVPFSFKEKGCRG